MLRCWKPHADQQATSSGCSLPKVEVIFSKIETSSRATELKVPSRSQIHEITAEENNYAQSGAEPILKLTAITHYGVFELWDKV